MEFISDLLYIFVAAYTLYFFAIALRNLNDKSFKNELKHIAYQEKENLAVIVYAHNNKNTRAKLISELKDQD